MFRAWGLGFRVQGLGFREGVAAVLYLERFANEICKIGQASLPVIFSWIVKTAKICMFFSYIALISPAKPLINTAGP